MFDDLPLFLATVGAEDIADTGTCGGVGADGGGIVEVGGGKDTKGSWKIGGGKGMRGDWNAAG